MTVESSNDPDAHDAPPDAPGPKPAAREDLCSYVSEICEQLAAMATESRLDLLAYLLSMARYEAERLKHECT